MLFIGVPWCLLVCHVISVSCCLLVCHVVYWCAMLSIGVSCCLLVCHVVYWCAMLSFGVSCCLLVCYIVCWCGIIFLMCFAMLSIGVPCCLFVCCMTVSVNRLSEENLILEIHYWFWYRFSKYYYSQHIPLYVCFDHSQYFFFQCAHLIKNANESDLFN